MKKTILGLLCFLVLVLILWIPQPANAAQEYTTLAMDTTLEVLEGQTLWVDLNGNDLTVTGSGILYAFDSANDNYDAACCGVVTNNGTVSIVTDVQAPNGNRYIALGKDTTTTMHRLDVHLTAVTLRASEAGLYYKATYNCDTTLAANVGSYGVVLSVDNMPGADFLTETGDINRYTVAKDFQSGITATSGSVFGIMKTEREAASNDAYAAKVIYANPYIRLTDGAVLVGDTQNAGKEKSDDGFTGNAYSLQDVMHMLDASYPGCSLTVRGALDDFYFTWQNDGMDWNFVNIGRSYTSKVNLDENNQGYCAVCRATVTWETLSGATSQKVLEAGKHYYLTQSLTYTGGSNSFISAPATKNKTACLNLNGYDITATKSHAITANSGILNVLGSGTVTGYTSDYRYGGAVTCNVTTTTSAINLYSGTYKRTDNSAGDGTAHVLAIRNNGGNLNLYADVVVEATGAGNAICVGTTNNGDSDMCLYGATVNGNIFVRPKSDNGITKGYKSNITISSATITGTVTLDASQDTIKLMGSPVIGTLVIPEGFLISLDDIQEGTAVNVNANGIFTKANTNVKDWVSYFTTKLENKQVYVKTDALACGAVYTANLQLDDNSQAYCPVCKKTVTWTALDSVGAKVKLTDGEHRYLTKSLTYKTTSKATSSTTSPYFIAAPETGGHSACLHLNGFDITSTTTHVIYANKGTLNVMGSGTVTGYTFDEKYGGAVTCNTAAATSTINLYGGTYKRTDDSAGSGTARVISIRNNGGNLNLYADVIVEATGEGNAISINTSKSGNSNLNLYGATVNGNISVRAKASGSQYKSNLLIDSATITGTVTLHSSQDDAILRGRPVIGQLSVPSGFLVTMDALQNGTSVKVSANGVFTKANENAQRWNDYFTAGEDTKWVVVQNKALVVTEKTTLENGKKVIFIGNSYTYYGKCVIEKGQTVYSQNERSNDQGYFYQICKANGVEVNVTNFTYGGHTLEDIYSGSCAADRGHDGHDHLADLTDRNYDYVILQNGSNSANKPVVLDEVRPLMELFLSENPNTKFVFLVHYKVHESDYIWRNSIKELEEAGIIVVDWGALVNDVMTGTTAVPGATQVYNKHSFIVNKSASDGFHPNVLTGYLTAQMLYCAVTGESAQGQDYSFWNDPFANAVFDMDAYKETYYAYDATVPSNTNFEAIFASAADMAGLQQLIDQYWEEKGYRNY